MDPLPYRFERLAEEAAKEAREFQHQSADERLQAIFDLIAFGEDFLALSPQRETMLRLRSAEEAEWQRIHKELFARHGQ